MRSILRTVYFLSFCLFHLLVFLLTHSSRLSGFNSPAYLLLTFLLFTFLLFTSSCLLSVCLFHLLIFLCSLLLSYLSPTHQPITHFLCSFSSCSLSSCCLSFSLFHLLVFLPAHSFCFACLQHTNHYSLPLLTFLLFPFLMLNTF
jgi:hypothetical protein